MSVHERNIVPRRRLLARMRDVTASTILLTAPAGYGKTTVAHQWLEQAGGSALTVTQGVADVAVLSRELIAVLGDLLPIDPGPVELALRVEQSPGRAGPGSRTDDPPTTRSSPWKLALHRRLPPPDVRRRRRGTHWRS